MINEKLDPVFKFALFLLFTAPLVFYSSSYEGFTLVKKCFIQITVLGLISFWFFTACKKNDTTLFLPRLIFPFLLFLLVGFLLIFHAKESYLSFLQWIYWFICFLFFIVVLNLINNERKIRLCLITLTLAAALVSLQGILQYLFHWDWPHHNAPPGSFFGNKNISSVVSLLLFPSAIILFLTEKMKSKNLWIGVTILIALYIFYSSTRSSWLGITTEILLLLFYIILRPEFRKQFYSKKTIRSLIFMGIIFIIFANLGPEGWKSSLPRIQERIASIADVNPNKQNRITIWSNSLLLIARNPFLGLGIDNFRVHYQGITQIGKHDPELQLGVRHFYTHNDYLQLSAELGVVLFLSFIVLFFIFLWPAIREVMIDSPFVTPIEKYRLAAFLGLIGLAIDACFSYPSYSAIPPFWGAVLLAIFICKEPPDSPRGFSIALSPKISKGLSLFFAIICLVWSFCLVRMFLADIAFRSQAMALQGDDSKNILFWGDQVRKYDPYRLDTVQYSCQGDLLLQNYLKALVNCERYFKTYPYDTHNLFHLAEINKGLGNLDRAELFLKQILKLMIDNSRVHESMAEIDFKRNQIEEGLAELKKTVELEPKNARLTFNLGITYFQYGKYPEAIATLERGLYFNNMDPKINGALGYLYYRFSNRKNEGILLMEKALNLDPNVQNGDEYRKTLLEAKK